MQRIKELMGEVETLKVSSEKLQHAKTELEEERKELLQAADRAREEGREMVLREPGEDIDWV